MALRRIDNVGMDIETTEKEARKQALVARAMKAFKLLKRAPFVIPTIEGFRARIKKAGLDTDEGVGDVLTRIYREVEEILDKK